MNQRPIVFGNAEPMLDDVSNDLIGKARRGEWLMPWIVLLKSVEKPTEEQPVVRIDFGHGRLGRPPGVN